MSDLNDVRDIVLTFDDYYVDENSDLTDYNIAVDDVISQYLSDQELTETIQEFRENNYKDLRKWIYPDLIFFFQFMAVLEYIDSSDDFMNQWMYIFSFIIEYMQTANKIQTISNNFPSTYI